MTTASRTPVRKPNGPTHPTGPAGPSPEPRGPVQPDRPAQPPKLADAVATADVLLAAIQLLADRELVGSPAAELMTVHTRLRLTRRAVHELAVVAGIDLPARRVLSRTVASPDTAAPGELGPKPPTREVGERLTPGYGTAVAAAVTGSGGSVVAPVAGASFSTPQPPRLVFSPGARRLVGRVQPKPPTTPDPPPPRPPSALTATYPDGTPPFPGSPPTPPPPSPPPRPEISRT